MGPLLEGFAAAVGAVALLAGGAWAFWRFFLFGELAQVLRAKVDRTTFADASEAVLLVEATITNVSKTRTEVAGVSYRALYDSHLSRGHHDILRRSTDWTPAIVAGPGQWWTPGETAQVVLAIPWPAGSAPLPAWFPLVNRATRRTYPARSPPSSPPLCAVKAEALSGRGAAGLPAQGSVPGVAGAVAERGLRAGAGAATESSGLLLLAGQGRGRVRNRRSADHLSESRTHLIEEVNMGSLKWNRLRLISPTGMLGRM